MKKIFTKRLYRSRDNKVIAGVMGGLGEYFDVDPALFRVVYLCFTVFTGLAPGILAYLLMCLVMPKEVEIQKEPINTK